MSHPYFLILDSLHFIWHNCTHCTTAVPGCVVIHMVTRILSFSLYLFIVFKYEPERLLPRISWEKISINHLAFDFNNIDIWSDIWRFTLEWNLTKSAFGLSIEFRLRSPPPCQVGLIKHWNIYRHTYWFPKRHSKNINKNKSNKMIWCFQIRRVI